MVTTLLFSPDVIPARRTTSKIVLITGILFFCWNQLTAKEDLDDKTLSPYFVVISENPEVDDLPLKETTVKADIVGVIADVTVKQVYVNNGKNPLEAIYTFPLSTKAAVYGMKMTIGTRMITAKIEEKEKARKDYEQAKSEGKRASLLEQSRPNVFTMNVSNIMVNDTIIVELKYTELLIPEKGQYTFVYPTVVGPRYSNKNKNTAEINDEYVATPYTKSGEMPANSFDLEVTVNAGIPIQYADCQTHKMNIINPSLTKTILQLDQSDSNGGNRDVIISYSLQGDKIESGVMLYEGEDENFFLVMVQPPKKVLNEDIPPREYVFIIDVSGSMHGFPLDVAKKLARNLIVNLKPTDKFNVILFSYNTGLYSESSVYATAENVEKALDYIDKHNGGGNTELLQALEDAYRIPREDPDLSRTFLIVTDGYIDVEREAFEMIRKNSDETNVFTFGIGSSVNRFLIEGMAYVGNGEPLIITNRTDADKKAEQFRTYINTPVLTRIKANYGSFQVYDVEPVAIPDMMAERPIVIFRKYKGKPSGTITLSGKAGRKTYKQTFDLSNSKPEASNAAIRYLWARDQIKLLNYMASDNANNTYQKDESYIQRITRLGLKYNLITNYTSFIAIDEQIVNKDGQATTVKQPLPMPEGVSDYAVGYDPGTLTGGSMAEMMQISEDAIFEEILLLPVEVEEEETESTVFSIVEIMPEFPGGEKAMKEFIDNAMKYPEIAKENGIQGRVVLTFIVDTDGSITDIEIVCGIDPSLDQEAIRIVKSMPKWKPGKQNGKPVQVKYTLPVVFRI